MNYEDIKVEFQEASKRANQKIIFDLDMEKKLDVIPNVINASIVYDEISYTIIRFFDVEKNVYLAYDSSTKEIVVIKSRRLWYIKPCDHKWAINEYNSYRKISNILEPEEYVKVRKHILFYRKNYQMFIIIMDHFERIPEPIHKNNFKILWGILKKLHANDICHMDISMDNILFNNKRSVFIDFETSIQDIESSELRLDPAFDFTYLRVRHVYLTDINNLRIAFSLINYKFFDLALFYAIVFNKKLLHQIKSTCGDPIIDFLCCKNDLLSITDFDIHLKEFYDIGFKILDDFLE